MFHLKNYINNKNTSSDYFIYKTERGRFNTPPD